MKNVNYLVHLVAYYAAWFFGLTFAARGKPWASSLVALCCVALALVWQYQIQQRTRGLWFLMGLTVCSSTLIDSLFVFNSVIVYSENPFAPYITSPWMIAQWVSFTVLLYATMTTLFNHLIGLGLVSFFGFAAAYALGAKMGAAYFPYGYTTCFFIGGIWLVMLPIIGRLYKKRMDRTC